MKGKRETDRIEKARARTVPVSSRKLRMLAQIIRAYLHTHSSVQMSTPFNLYTNCCFDDSNCEMKLKFMRENINNNESFGF